LEVPEIAVHPCLDTVDQCLWVGSERVALTPKAYALLVYLAERPRRLVTKDELLESVWAGAVVTDGVLKVCVRELRVALRDDARAPSWIETRHRRGYAFLRELPRRAATVNQVPVLTPGSPAPAREAGGHFIGREAELGQLQRALERALQGEREIVFVTGPPGIGKTALVEACVRDVERRGLALVARGQCLESFGAGEAYRPVLDALSGLGRGARRTSISAWLARSAPTWLVQLPSLCDPRERERLAREVLGATRERMLREMAEALEGLAAETPLVLLLEDLHWSDPSTLDLVALLARRRDPARLLCLLTYRTVDVLAADHPLKALKLDLASRKLCREIALQDLGAVGIARYLDARFPGHALPASFVQALHRRTQGHPLFFVHVVDWLAEKGVLRERSGRLVFEGDPEVLAREVPESIREVLELQISRLSAPEQRVLEAAAVAGLEFSSAAVAAGVEQDTPGVEEHCDELARRGVFVRPVGVGQFPDGSLSARYAFTHGLHADVLYHRVAAARRARLHQRIGVRGEELYGERMGEIAAELAVHFEEGRDFARAVRFSLRAAENDARRYANREATTQLERVLELATRLPERARADATLTALESLGLVRRSMGDMAGSVEAFEALVEMARAHGQGERQVRGLLYLASALFWVDHERCLAAVDRAVEASARVEDELLRAHALGYCGHWNLNLRGFARAHVLACERAVSAGRRAGDARILVLHVVRLAFARILEARYAEAVAACDEGFELALAAGDAFEWLLATFFRAWALLHAGRWAELLETLASGLAMAEKNGHRSWSMLFRLERAQLASAAHDFEPARALAAEVLAQASESPEPTGQILFHGRIALAEALIGLARPAEAEAVLDEIERGLARENSLMDWMLYLPLRRCEAECRLALGDLDRARTAAADLAARAEQCGERTYQALALDLSGRIAARAGDEAEARAALRRALALTEEHDLPLARSRVLRTALERGGERELRLQARAHFRRLSEQLAGDSGSRRVAGVPEGAVEVE